MADISRLKRVTDLFVEGTEAFMGLDDDGKPVVIWVNKLNPFQAEECRRDAAARRGLRIAELDKEDSSERRAMLAEMGMWEIDKLASEYVQLQSQEIMVDVYDELESDEEARDAMNRSTRMAALLEDAQAPADDPRRQQLDDDNKLWLGALEKLRDKAFGDALKDAQRIDREDLTAAYLAKWLDQVTMQDFMDERRTTELWYAMRDCDGTQDENGRWHHGQCDHSVRLVKDRGEVRELPEGVLSKVVETFDNLRVPAREAGNSDAPVSSADSSEPSSTETAGSTPSSPDETPAVVPTV